MNFILEMQESHLLEVNGIEIGEVVEGEVALFVHNNLFGTYEVDYDLDVMSDDLDFLLANA